MIINKLKRQIVMASHRAGHGHIPSAFSILEIVWTLYNDVMLPEDRFILSKGHGALALYAVLEEKGVIPTGTLETFGQKGSILGGHPDRNKVPRVLASTGSLGHGLPIAVGVALGKKIKKEPGHVYVLVGDGELNEGSCWESLLLANQHDLDNLTIIVDYNKSNKYSVDLYDLNEKFESFGLLVSPCFKGHDCSQIKLNLKHTKVMIAYTTKGKGCKRMENNPAWHHRAPDDQELKEILEELQ